MLIRILIIMVFGCFFYSANTQELRQNYIQYSSTGLNSDSGADLIDFDGDGKLDILMGFESRRDLTYHKNNGSVYTPEFVIDSLIGYTYVKSADFNSDGDEDFILGGNYEGS
ncbi:MAG: VCBS repeat-containing protein, partial [Bacteroidota bacterium]